VARTPAGDVRPSTKPPPPANDDRKPPPPAADRKFAIVTVRDRRTREQQQMARLLIADQPKRSAIIDNRPGEDMTPEEHKRRGERGRCVVPRDEAQDRRAAMTEGTSNGR
jgi:hypothetical protein